MEPVDQVLLELLLLAMAAFPAAVFLYLRTAYRKGGWPPVKTAAIIALIAMLVPVGVRLWLDWEVSHFQRTLDQPFALGSILLVVLMWFTHRALKLRRGETNDHH